MTLSQQVAQNAERIGHPIPHVRCGHCNTGLVPLPTYLLQIWDALSDKPQIVSEIAKACGISLPGAKYRLNLMMGLGLARIASKRAGQKGRTKPADEWVRGELVHVEGP